LRSANYIEVEIDVVPLDVCGVVFGSPYMYMRDAIFMKRLNQYRLVKDGKSFIINAHKGKIQDLFGKCQPSKEIDYLK
jgi:hypothetical protein